jgi:hypothetical protein
VNELNIGGKRGSGGAIARCFCLTQPDFTMLRYASLSLLLAGSCCADEAGKVRERLKAEIREMHPYAPPAPVESSPLVADESVLQLDPVKVTRPAFRVEDLLAEARRAAEAEKARRFSPLTGGLIYSKNFGGKELNLGIWPMLVPTNETPVKKGEVMLRVDLLRLKW